MPCNVRVPYTRSFSSPMLIRVRTKKMGAKKSKYPMPGMCYGAGLTLPKLKIVKAAFEIDNPFPFPLFPRSL